MSDAGGCFVSGPLVLRDAALYLRSLGMFDPSFLDVLGGVRFTGRVRAVPEGTAIFPDEPLLEVTAPIVEAQLVETAVMNICHLQTMLASKAARSVAIYCTDTVAVPAEAAADATAA